MRSGIDSLAWRSWPQGPGMMYWLTGKLNRRYATLANRCLVIIATHSDARRDGGSCAN